VGAQQREQSQRLGFVRHQLGDDRSEADRFGAEGAAHVGVAGAGRVPLVEDEVDDVEHGLEALGQRFVARHAEGDLGHADLRLGPRQPLRHRGLRHKKRMRNLGGREAAEQPECQRDLRFTRERGMAAGEDQPQPLVRHARCYRSFHGGLVWGRRRERRQLGRASP
jgi:hypothetical protein